MVARDDIITIVLGCMDVTCLSPMSASECKDFVAMVRSSPIPVAALCVHPDTLPTVRTLTELKLATVLNFPTGDQVPSAVEQQLAQSIDDGADEVDYVLDFRALIHGDTEKTVRSLSRVAAKAGSKTLKVIIESGELVTPGRVALATKVAIEGGANFVKTSTGMTPVGATEEHVSAILDVLDGHRHVGIKISGGIKTLEQATRFVDLIAARRGHHFLEASTFRIGASSLLRETLASV